MVSKSLSGLGKIAVITAIFFILAGCFGPGYTKYDNLDKGFSVGRPNGWIISESPVAVVFKPENDNLATITFASMKSNSHMDSGEYFSALMTKNVRTLHELDEVSEVNATEKNYSELKINGIDGRRLDYTLTYIQSGVRYKTYNRVLFFSKDDRYYSIMLTVKSPQNTGDSRKEEYLKVFQTMVSSIEIK